MHCPSLNFTASYDLFLGIFPLNILNKVAMIPFGLAEIIVSRSGDKSLMGSITWSKWVFFVMGPLAALGLIPATQTLLGLMPLYGAEVATHGAYALIAVYFAHRLPITASSKIKPLTKTSAV